ncbi:MAG: radical SAM protein [bacterium]
MAKILLVNPHSLPFFFSVEKRVTLSILYLSSYAKQFGHEVLFIDVDNDQRILHLLGEDFLLSDYYKSHYYKKIADFNPDIIGVTVHFSGRFKPAIEFIKLFKNDFSTVPCVIGGIYPTLFPEEILGNYADVDYILKGESEATFVELINSIVDDTNRLKQIDGLAFRDKGKAIINEKKNFISDVDKIPFPDYDLIDIKKYYFDTSKWYNPKNYSININLPILTTRSCPNQCTYCSMYKVHGRGFRKRSVENVVDEIEYLYNRFNQQYFSFTDDNLTFDKKRILRICSEIVRRRIKIQFDTPNGLDINRLDSEVLEALVNVGLIKTCIAVESGSPKIRESINKFIPQEKIFDVVSAIRRFPEVRFSLLFVIGFPKETLDTLNETYLLIDKLGVHKFSMNYAVPYLGTKLFQECYDNKLIEGDALDFINIANFSHESEAPFIKPYELGKQDLIDFRKKIIKELHQ